MLQYNSRWQGSHEQEDEGVKASFRLGSIGGVEIGVHYTWFFALMQLKMDVGENSNDIYGAECVKILILPRF